MAMASTGLWLGSLVLTAIGWFALGWLARGQENRRYAENRLRHLAEQAVAQCGPAVESRACVGSERLGAAALPAVNVYLAAPGVPVLPHSPVVGSVTEDRAWEEWR